jgi:hypothetical protein
VPELLVFGTMVGGECDQGGLSNGDRYDVVRGCSGSIAGVARLP